MRIQILYWPPLTHRQLHPTKIRGLLIYFLSINGDLLTSPHICPTIRLIVEQVSPQSINLSQKHVGDEIGGENNISGSADNSIYGHMKRNKIGGDILGRGSVAKKQHIHKLSGNPL